MTTSSLLDRHRSLSEANGFHLGMSEGAHEDIMEVLFEDPETKAEWERGVICVVTRSSGTERVSFLVHDVLKPDAGDVNYDGRVQFTADYRYEAVQKARNVGESAGLLYVHTHPNLANDETAQPNPSRGDLDAAESDLFEDACKLGEEAPLGIAIVKDDSREWRVLGYEFDTPETAGQRENPAYSPDSVNVYEGDCVRVVGESLTEYPTTVQTPGVEGAVAPVDEDAQESTVNIWGEEGQEQLNALRVGLVGLGGGGSILAEHLARMGVGEVVQVDYDRLEPANLNRAQGATQADVDARRPKAKIGERLARLGATAPEFSVDAIEASVTESRPEYGALHRLLDCDVILHAAEGEWPTRVLDEIAHAHLIPVISGGSNLLNQAGVLTEKAYAQNIVSGPGQPCQNCARHWTKTGANDEMNDPDATGPGDYGLDMESDEEVGENVDTENEDEDEREPSTNALNLIVAGQMLLRLQDLVVGVSGTQVGIRRFKPGTWSMENGIPSCKNSCPMKAMEADGDTAHLPLSSDPKFAKLRRSL
ncbi:MULTISPECIES: HesA/MoeB/ThiF family protein [Halorussus]|uniref:HesA/MoeB/ThiF family protein n=1 Tax=Halorussus TaxID=1070314 RepID=UPI0020A09D31|nr:ThiF family adenylyltransferase [Halorussus vallis]USZ78700.1 ThiF family adenylyltransferase [Halorussus vallis]